MTKTFSRQELYDLVWSEPMRDLAKKHDISDRGLAKACANANIPVPERGYWNKLQAGKKVSKVALPPRGLAKSDNVVIGGYSWHSDWPSNQQILENSIPPAPVFPEDMASVRECVAKMAGKAPLPKNLTKPHRFIAGFLAKDEERLQKKLNDRYPSIFDGPLFDSPFEQRRLKIINALFTGLEYLGMTPSLRGKEARGLSAKIGDKNISFALDDVNAKEQLSYFDLARDKKPATTKMRFRIEGWRLPEDIQGSWEDNENGKIEEQLKDILAGLIIAAEAVYRAGVIRRHEHIIERKAELIEEERKRKIEEERRFREHQIKLEKERVEHLLSQATALRQANEIRTFIETLRQENFNSEKLLPVQEFQEWEAWATAQADNLDPIKSGKFKLRPEEK